MSDMDAIFQALAVLAKQNRELEQRVTELECARTEDRERLNAHGRLLTTAPRWAVRQHYEAQLAQLAQVGEAA